MLSIKKSPRSKRQGNLKKEKDRVNKNRRWIVVKTPSEYEWVRYFQQEKIHLQQGIPVLKTLYPHVADFLKSLGPHASDSVETWVDVLAWMTAGLKHKIDHRFSTWVESLLTVVSPELTHPFPSCGIVQMKVNPEKNAALDGYKIPKKTRLYAPLSKDKKAIFSVGMETEYQAFALQGTAFAPLPGDKHYGLGLKISLRSLTHPEAYLGRTIRFAILGDMFSSQALYSAIHGQSLTTKHPTLFWQTQPNEAPLPLEKQTLGKVGWNPEDALCDYPYTVHPGRRLLLEYYAFPQRFLFFEITLPSQAPKNLVHDLDLWIVLPSFFDLRKVSFPPLCLALNACPVINLFPTASLPIVVDHSSEAYLLEVDTAQEKCLHHVQQVVVITEEETKKTIQPAFKAPLFNTREVDQRIRWHIRKDRTEKRERFWISFEGVPPEACAEPWYVHAHTLCYQPHLLVQEIQMDDGLVSAHFFISESNLKSVQMKTFLRLNIGILSSSIELKFQNFKD